MHVHWSVLANDEQEPSLGFPIRLRGCNVQRGLFHVLLTPRSAGGHDLCPLHPGHGHLRASDDVLHHTAHRLLHRVDLWGRDHPYAVLHEHTVSVCVCVSVCHDGREREMYWESQDFLVKSFTVVIPGLPNQTEPGHNYL